MAESGVIAQVGTSLTSVLGWVGSVVDSLLNTDGDLNALLGLFTISIGASLFMFAMKAIRKVTWGA